MHFICFIHHRLRLLPILVPYTKNQRYCLNKHLRKLNQATMGFKFMAHIGDIKQGTTSCSESSFSDIAEMFSHPTNAIHYDTEDCFFVPGDNEFQDCQDRTQAWRWWMKCKYNVILRINMMSRNNMT